MSKAVMISIRPKWCQKIASGEKTIEVRKTKPKLGTPFKPKGAMAEIKREVFIRLQAYQQRTKLGWAQRVSDATGGKVAPDVVRLGLLEARDIGVDRWKLIGKALDKLEEEMEK